MIFAVSKRGACHTIQLQFKSQTVTLMRWGLENKEKRVFSHSTLESLVLDLAAALNRMWERQRFVNYEAIFIILLQVHTTQRDWIVSS